MTIRYRPATPEDERPAFEVFRSSLWAYVQGKGIVAGEDQDLDAAWARQGALMQHLQRTAALDWVAEDGEGRIVGMARSIERDGHVQLTHFFVGIDAQAVGVGRELLRRTFPLGWGRHRSIIATQHPRALGLYLRYGVEAHGVGLALTKKPQASLPTSDLVPRRVGNDPAATASVVAIESDVLGYRRPEDVEFLVSDRPVTLYERRGKVVGFGFGSNGLASGPAAVSDPRDLPAVLADQETMAAEAGLDEVQISLSSAAAHTLRWALQHGYRIVPFYEMLLLDAPVISFDRCAFTQPAFIW